MPIKFTDPTAVGLDNTIGRKLINPVDRIRDIATRFGVRPYKIRVVSIQWSSGYRGEGVPVTTYAVDLLPTPKLVSLDGVKEIVNPVGLDEAGDVRVIQISGRFTENQLRGYSIDGTPPDDGTEVYYEIEFPQPDGLPGLKRRFQLNGAPDYKASACQWRLNLNRAHDDRAATEPPT